MPSEMVDQQFALNKLTLQDNAPVERPVSGSEYYHASIGRSGLTLERDRQICFALEGTCAADIPAQIWRDAIASTTQANPALRMRWKGILGWSRWVNDGPLPALRMLDHVDWSLNSSEHMDFLDAWPIDLRHGPVVEFIVVRRPDNRLLVVMRTHHAIMDGMGGFHVLCELFRALRGEPLLGSNVTFSDAQLVEALNPPKSPSLRVPTCRLIEHSEPGHSVNNSVGNSVTKSLNQVDLLGDAWQRFSLGSGHSKALSKVACAFAALAHKSSTLPALIAVPVDLRRHMPAIRSVTNFSSMLVVKLMPGEGPKVFQARLRELLQDKVELSVAKGFNLIRWFPMWLVDVLLGRTRKNFLSKRPMETVVISNLGAVPLQHFQGAGFVADDFTCAPVPGNAFAVLMQINGDFRVVLGLTKAQLSQCRFDEIESFVNDELGFNS